jgi:sugar/nucleoside kinase (ribokinase family)
MTSVLVIGDVMTDIVVKPEGRPAPGADQRATIRRLPGGSGANQAAWLAAEGVAVTFAGRVGAEDHAQQAALFAASGVHAALASDEALPTGTLVTLVAPDGERSFLTDRGANRSLCRGDLPAALLDGIDLVHVSAYALFESGARAAVLDLLRAAGERGVPFSVDPSSWSFLEEVGRAAFLSWTRGARLCFPNEREATVLAGTDNLEAQLDVLGRLYPLLVLKRGDGAVHAAEAAGGGRWCVPAAPVKAVDSSGGGDAFLGGFLAAWLRGEPIEACLRRGVALGADAVTRLGARPPSAPSW